MLTSPPCMLSCSTLLLLRCSSQCYSLPSSLSPTGFLVHPWTQSALPTRAAISAPAKCCQNQLAVCCSPLHHLLASTPPHPTALLLLVKVLPLQAPWLPIQYQLVSSHLVPPQLGMVHRKEGTYPMHLRTASIALINRPKFHHSKPYITVLSSLHWIGHDE